MDNGLGPNWSYATQMWLEASNYALIAALERNKTKGSSANHRGLFHNKSAETRGVALHSIVEMLNGKEYVKQQAFEQFLTRRAATS